MSSTTEQEQRPSIATERHYTPQEVADILNVSEDSVIRWFRKEPGVIEMGNSETLHKRMKKLLRIPRSVLERFHERQRTAK